MHRLHGRSISRHVDNVLVLKGIPVVGTRVIASVVVKLLRHSSAKVAVKLDTVKMKPLGVSPLC